MFGLRYKCIRIEDQQLNLKIDKIINIFLIKDNLFIINIILEKYLMRYVDYLVNENLNLINYFVFIIGYVNRFKIGSTLDL